MPGLPFKQYTESYERGSSGNSVQQQLAIITKSGHYHAHYGCQQDAYKMQRIVGMIFLAQNLPKIPHPGAGFIRSLLPQRERSRWYTLSADHSPIHQADREHG